MAKDRGRRGHSFEKDEMLQNAKDKIRESFPGASKVPGKNVYFFPVFTKLGEKVWGRIELDVVPDDKDNAEIWIAMRREERAKEYEQKRAEKEAMAIIEKKDLNRKRQMVIDYLREYGKAERDEVLRILMEGQEKYEVASTSIKRRVFNRYLMPMLREKRIRMWKDEKEGVKYIELVEQKDEWEEE